MNRVSDKLPGVDPELLADLRNCNRTMTADLLERQQALLDEAGRVVGGIRWRSIDKDNMEFDAVITCFQMDKLRALLSKLRSKGDDA